MKEYTKRRHVIFVTPKMLDYCRCSEGDPEFPKSVRKVENGIATLTKRTDEEIVDWATRQAKRLDEEHSTTGFSFRTEEW